MVFCGWSGARRSDGIDEPASTNGYCLENMAGDVMIYHVLLCRVLQDFDSRIPWFRSVDDETLPVKLR